MTHIVDTITTADSEAAYRHLLVERRGTVAVITLNRPEALNALCNELTEELTAALDDTEADDSIGAVGNGGAVETSRRPARARR